MFYLLFFLFVFFSLFLLLCHNCYYFPAIFFFPFFPILLSTLTPNQLMLGHIPSARKKAGAPRRWNIYWVSAASRIAITGSDETLDHRGCNCGMPMPALPNARHSNPRRPRFGCCGAAAPWRPTPRGRGTGTSISTATGRPCRPPTVQNDRTQSAHGPIRPPQQTRDAWRPGPQRARAQSLLFAAALGVVVVSSEPPGPTRYGRASLLGDRESRDPENEAVREPGDCDGPTAERPGDRCREARARSARQGGGAEWRIRGQGVDAL